MLVVVFGGDGRRAQQGCRRSSAGSASRCWAWEVSTGAAGASRTGIRSATGRPRLRGGQLRRHHGIVAARWSKLGDLYGGGVRRRALGVTRLRHGSTSRPRVPRAAALSTSRSRGAPTRAVRRAGWDARCAANLRPRLEGRARRRSRGGRHFAPSPGVGPLPSAAASGPSWVTARRRPLADERPFDP